MSDENQARWREIAERSQDAADAAIDRKHRAFLACGTPRRDLDGLLEQAYDIARILRREDGANFHLSALPPGKLDPGPAAQLRSQSKVIPGDYIGVHADQLLAMEHRLADAEAAMHSARTELARWMSGEYREQTAAELERVRENLANVANGLSWDGTPR